MQPLYPSLVFPDTDIFSYDQVPLMLFGSPVIFLELAEPASEEQISERRIFTESGLCRAHNPAPLGDDRERFLRLVEDIGSRKDDYAAQLSALTVAAMSAGADETGGEKRHQILSSMLGNSPQPSGETGELQRDLWQARLVLAISEILEKEEAELHQELQLLDAQEIEMFKSLQGDAAADETNPFSEVQRIAAHLKQARPQEMKMRFRSWLTLMRAGTLPAVSLFLASSIEAGDQLITEYEKRHEGTVRPILELNLPERIEAGPVHVVSQIQRFHEQSFELRKTICSDLETLLSKEFASSDSADTLLPTGPDYLSSWNAMVDDHFPPGSHGSASLLFYLLPNSPVIELLNLRAESTAPHPVHGLFAALKH